MPRVASAFGRSPSFTIGDCQFLLRDHHLAIGVNGLFVMLCGALEVVQAGIGHSGKKVRIGIVRSDAEHPGK